MSDQASITDQLQADLKSAMLSGDKQRAETLRNLKSSLLYVAVESGKRDEGLSDKEVEAVLYKELKKRKESADLFQQGGNADAAQKERDEATIIQEYLPSALSEAEIRSAVEAAITAVSASSASDVGKVVGKVREQHGGSADGATVAKIAKELLG